MALHNETKQLASFLAAIGMTRLVEDPRFATLELRRKNSVALTAILDEVFATRDLAEWRQILEAAGVTFGAVFTVNEAAEDSQSLEIGAIVPFADGKGSTVSSPFHLDGEVKVSARRAPKVGEHTTAVLAEAGYSGDEIARLKGLGVLG
jgi:formyl-CoA transferase